MKMFAVLLAISSTDTVTSLEQTDLFLADNKDVQSNNIADTNAKTNTNTITNTITDNNTNTNTSTNTNTFSWPTLPGE